MTFTPAFIVKLITPATRHLVYMWYGVVHWCTFTRSGQFGGWTCDESFIYIEETIKNHGKFRYDIKTLGTETYLWKKLVYFSISSYVQPPDCPDLTYIDACTNNDNVSQHLRHPSSSESDKMGVLSTKQWPLMIIPFHWPYNQIHAMLRCASATACCGRHFSMRTVGETEWMRCVIKFPCRLNGLLKNRSRVIGTSTACAAVTFCRRITKLNYGSVVPSVCLSFCRYTAHRTYKCNFQLQLKAMPR